MTIATSKALTCQKALILARMPLPHCAAESVQDQVGEFFLEGQDSRPQADWAKPCAS